ncbi:TetR/AcrR family transcriptional regulator [Microbacterium yannicii]|uniref:TetR/AcrR family transcriptional regulator n=1 Tax=Microbacterium yannicii TaxID=671622 RepID=A0ABP9LXF4_9MICO|nr:TetR/AcrR family transcriptional regulator [Microbacterium yannicii]MCO5953705.1 TetR/AcrR family transcriptional regulator [Microbacterium yannicii]
MASAPDPNRRSERARVAVLEAAIALCREVGFGQLTIEGIAERAGVSKKTIYRWWPSKGAVLLDAVSELVDRIARHGDTGDLAADMCAQLNTVVAMMNPQEMSPVAALASESQRDPALAAVIRERVILPSIAGFEDRMRSAQRAGQIPVDADLHVALDLFYGPIYHRLVYRLPLHTEEEIRTRVDHVIAGLRAMG